MHRKRSRKSVIDFVVVSSDLIKHIEYMHIDEERVHVLTKLTKSKHGKTTKVESDHNLIETKLNVSWNATEDDPIEVINFKDKVGQEKFYEATNDTEDLTKIFESNKTLQVQTKKFLKRLNGFIHQSFKKVKIVRKFDAKLEELYNVRRYWRSRSDENSKEELEKVEKELAEKYSETM